jgi:L-rhamnose mutarotase
MQRHAFKMFLNPGAREEYRRRHDDIWPELKTLLREKGVRNYSIYLDRETNVLYANLECSDDHGMEDLPSHPVMRRWWDHMKDIMRANPDGSPVAIALEEMFFLS